MANMCRHTMKALDHLHVEASFLIDAKLKILYDFTCEETLRTHNPMAKTEDTLVCLHKLM